jgi:hypothetical protein
MPKVDDCITLFLGSLARRRSIMEEEGTYFLTKGWIQGERTLLDEYYFYAGKIRRVHCKRNFRRNAGRLSEVGRHRYRSISGRKNFPDIEKISETFDLKIEFFKGDLHIIKKLISGDEDTEISICISKNSIITEKELCLF